MTKQFYLIIAAMTLLLSSCLKQSIPDAMLGRSGKQNKVAATLRYEINGTLVTISVDDADNQGPGLHTLECVKSNVYNLNAVSSSGEFVFTFLTDTLKVGSYNYPPGSGGIYVTDFQGTPVYVYSATDNMNFEVTQYKDGHISGTFSGLLTPGINNSYGLSSSVTITNGSFTNVPIVY
jgi:hypothetical protein